MVEVLENDPRMTSSTLSSITACKTCEPQGSEPYTFSSVGRKVSSLYLTKTIVDVAELYEKFLGHVALRITPMNRKAGASVLPVKTAYQVRRAYGSRPRTVLRSIRTFEQNVEYSINDKSQPSMQ